MQNLQLDALTDYLPEVSELAGTLDGDISLAGTGDEPQAYGSVTLEEGRLRILDNPTLLEQLSARFVLQGESARVDGLGRLGGGDFSLGGRLFPATGSPAWKLAISGQRHQLLVPPSLEMTVSQELTISASPGQVDVRGDIRVREGVLEFEQLPAGSVGLSDDVVLVDYRGEIPARRRSFATGLDLRVAISDRFRIAGSSLNANVGGDLQLLQRPGLPLELFGNLNVLGGELNAFGQRLIVERGTVSFVGAPERPELDVRAQRDIPTDNITVGVALRGTQDSPELEIYSSPSMSQTEALSWLARGRGLDSGASGGVDAAGLALSMGYGGYQPERRGDRAGAPARYQQRGVRNRSAGRRHHGDSQWLPG